MGWVCLGNIFIGRFVVYQEITSIRLGKFREHVQILVFEDFKACWVCFGEYIQGIKTFIVYQDNTLIRARTLANTRLWGLFRVHGIMERRKVFSSFLNYFRDSSTRIRTQTSSPRCPSRCYLSTAP